MTEDIDHPPASDDLDVQGFLDIMWRAAMAGTRESMESLRAIHPELVDHLPESAQRDLSSALTLVTSAYRDLHRCGKEIIGQAAYDEYQAVQTNRALRR